MALELQKHTTTLHSHERQMPVTTFIRDTFFPEVETFLSEDVVVEYSKEGALVAPFVADNVGGTNIEREGGYAKRYTAPRVAPQRPVSPEILKQRMLGEGVHSQMTPEERAAKILAKDAWTLDRQITRREEVMASQLITTGKVEVHGYLDDSQTDYVDQSVDFGHTQRIVLTGTDRWTGSTAKRYDDIGRACEMVMRAGFNPRISILGVESYKQLLDDENFLKKLDISNLTIAKIAPTLNVKQGQGIKYIGNISEFGIDLYAYYAWYYDKKLRKQIAYIPDDKVIVAPEQIGGFLYGAITQMNDAEELETHEGTRIPKVWARKEHDTKMLRISSRFLAKPDDIDSWAVIETGV